MDDAVAGGVDVALATAVDGRPVRRAPAASLRAVTGPRRRARQRCTPSPFLAAPGGVPLVVDGRVVGGLGVGGADPKACAEIARRGGRRELSRVRVAVLGCGAIGSLYAAHLARVAGVEVWAVDPWAEHVAAIERDGLRVTGNADFVAPVRAVTDAAELPACAFGIVATKALHTREAVQAARARARATPRSSACRTASATRRSSPRSCRASSAAAS